jgi:hypothetical protein
MLPQPPDLVCGRLPCVLFVAREIATADSISHHNLYDVFLGIRVATNPYSTFSAYVGLMILPNCHSLCILPRTTGYYHDRFETWQEESVDTVRHGRSVRAIRLSPVQSRSAVSLID